MAVQAQFVFGGLAGCLLPCGGGGLAEDQMQALLSAAAGNRPHGYKYNCAVGGASAAQSDLTCNGLVRAECDRLRVGAGAGAEAAAPGAGARRRGARAAEVEAELALDASRRRAAGLEELLRWAAAESQAWCGLARSNGAVAAGLRAAIDAVLLQGAGSGTARPGAVEGFGDSGGTDADDDARSCCCAEAVDTAATASSSSSPWNGKWACRACGEGEPCRHLCLCKVCERRTDACPVCSGAKNASIHIAPN